MIQRYEEILQNAIAIMAAEQDKVTDFNEGSVIFAYLDTVARLGERCFTAIRQEFNEMLDLIPYSLFDFKRKQGEFANGFVRFSRENPINGRSVIPKGTKIEGGGFVYITSLAGVIEAGQTTSGDIPIIAENVGSDYNCPAGTINIINSTVPVDVVMVTNTKDVTGGLDEESNVAFDERFKAYLAALQGTNLYGIKNAASSVDGVRSVSIQNHKPPLKNIFNMTVYIDDGSGAANSKVLENVKKVIEGNGTKNNPGYLAPGVNARFIAASIIPVNVICNIRVADTDYDLAKSEVKNIIQEYFDSRYVGDGILIADLIKNILYKNYVKDVRIVSPAENITVESNQVLKASSIIVNVEDYQ